MTNPNSDPLIGEYANIIRSVYVSKSHLQEWEVTARYENVEFPIRVFGEVAAKLKQCGLVLELHKAQDFSKAPYLFTVGYDAKHNRRTIEALHTAQGLKVLAELPRRVSDESPAMPVLVRKEATVTQVTPQSTSDKLALMKQLATELLEAYPDDSKEKAFAALILMDLACITGERMAPPKRAKQQSNNWQNKGK